VNNKRTAGRFLGFAVRLDVLGGVYCEKGDTEEGFGGFGRNFGIKLRKIFKKFA